MDERLSPTSDRTPEITVLVVDDEHDIAYYLSSVLEDAGMNVLVAHDGLEALEILERQTPDLISLDLVMPRKSGIRLLADLRRNHEWSRIPVIIVTAHARDPVVRNDLDQTLAESTMVGPSSYLEKPVTPEGYLRAVRQALRLEPNDEAAAEPAGGDRLRDEAMTLIEKADEATLKSILDRLRREH